MTMKGQGGFAIRSATLGDAERIYAMIHLNRDQLVPRSLGNVVEIIDRFFVAEAEGEMVGCATYQIHPAFGDAAAASPPRSCVTSLLRCRCLRPTKTDC